MEKITIEKIISFIDTAIEKGIELSYGSIFNELNINNDIKIAHWDTFITVQFKNYSEHKIELSEKDKLLLDLAFIKAREYSEDRTIRGFNEYFSDNKKVKDINDLDDE